MKQAITILLVLISGVSFAQEISLPKSDSIRIDVKFKQDSVAHFMSQHKAGLNTSGIETDSLKSKLTLDSLVLLTKPNNFIEKTSEGLRHRKEELKNTISQLDSGQTVVVQKIDSLTSRADLNKYIEKSMDTLNVEKLKQAEGKVNEKLALFSNNGGNVPGSINAPNIDLQTDIGKGIEIPNTELPSVNTHQLSNLAESIQESELAIPEIKPLTDGEISGVENIEAVTEVRDKIEPMQELGSDLKGYNEDLDKIKEGDLTKVEALPESIESKVGELDEVEAFSKEAKEFEAIKKNWNDPEMLKEQVYNKAKETAINHFAGHEEELKAMMSKVSEVKSKIPSPEGPIDILAKRQKFFKDTPLVERFLPGIALQFQKQESFWLDINAYTGFKISGRFIGGIGWNERVAYNFDKWYWDNKYRIYGVRSFLNFKVKDILSLKAEVELMNTPIKSIGFNSASEIIGRGWVWSYFAGVKKEFQFSKHLKGNVQMLYNLYNPERQSPYTNKFNIRMGFEFPIFKKKEGDTQVAVETSDANGVK